MDYKEKLELARDWYNDQSTTKKEKVLLENLFPELIVSKVEKVKKAIMHILYENYTDAAVIEGVEISEIVTWIEKQGELKEKPTKDQVWDYCNKISHEWWQITMDKWETLSDEEKSKYNQFIGFNDFSNILMNITAGALFQLIDTGKLEYEEGSLLFEKPDGKTYPILSDSSNIGKNEQKTTDKGEPKFKIGDWIAAAVYTWRVTGIKRLDYILQSQNGDTVDDTISFVDEQFHLWTIEDAKDGDVLCKDSIPFIFKCWANNCIAYCGITDSGLFKVVEDYFSWCNGINVTPATREQRELLFSKMKEAGYEWNAESKQLIRLTQQKAEHGKYYYCIKDYFSGGKKHASKGDVVQALRGLPIMNLKDVTEYFLPVNNVPCPTWSDEDENKCMWIVRLIGTARYSELESDKMPCDRNELIKWLKLLQYRIHSQQHEWNAEDESKLDLTISLLKDFKEVFKEDAESCIEWLKFLKPQWKPTKDQMEAFSNAIEFLKGEGYSVHELISLFNNLQFIRV
jgi:hypothetical protein